MHRTGLLVALVALAAATSQGASADTLPRAPIAGVTRAATVASRVAVRASADAAPVALSVTFKPRNAALLERLAATRSGARGLSTAELVRLFGPSRSELDGMSAYLRGHGLRPTGGGILTRSYAGSVADAEAAFATQLESYRSGGVSFRAPASTPTLPAALASGVLAISGLDTYPLATPALAPRAAPVNPLVGGCAPRPRIHTSWGGYEPAQLAAASAYNSQPLLDQGASGAGNAVALVEFSNYSAAPVADLPGLLWHLGSHHRRGRQRQHHRSLRRRRGAARRGGAGRIGPGSRSHLHLRRAQRHLVGRDDRSDRGRSRLDRRRRDLDQLGRVRGGHGLGLHERVPRRVRNGRGRGALDLRRLGRQRLRRLRAVQLQHGRRRSTTRASDPSVTGVGGTTLNTGTGGAGRETTWGYPTPAGGGGGGGGVSHQFAMPRLAGRRRRDRVGILLAAVCGQTTVELPRGASTSRLDGNPATGYVVRYTNSSSNDVWGQVGGTSAAAPSDGRAHGRRQHGHRGRRRAPARSCQCLPVRPPRDLPRRDLGLERHARKRRALSRGSRVRHGLRPRLTRCRGVRRRADRRDRAVRHRRHVAVRGAVGPDAHPGGGRDAVGHPDRYDHGDAAGAAGW